MFDVFSFRQGGPCTFRRPCLSPKRRRPCDRRECMVWWRRRVEEVPRISRVRLLLKFYKYLYWWLQTKWCCFWQMEAQQFPWVWTRRLCRRFAKRIKRSVSKSSFLLTESMGGEGSRQKIWLIIIFFISCKDGIQSSGETLLCKIAEQDYGYYAQRSRNESVNSK